MLEEHFPVGVQVETKTVWSGQLARHIEGLHPRQVDPREEGPRAGPGVRTASSHTAKLLLGPSGTRNQAEVSVKNGGGNLPRCYREGT